MKGLLYKKILASLLSLMMFLFLMTPILIKAAGTTCPQDTSGKITYCQLEPAAFSGFTAASGAASQLGIFLSQAFQFGLAIAAALAVIMIVWGGVEIMLSESLFKKEDGKKKVHDAIWGLLLALASWLILYTINPDILNFKL